MQNDNNERPTVSSLKQVTIAIKDDKSDSSTHIEPHQAIIHLILIDEKPFTQKVFVIRLQLLPNITCYINSHVA